MQEVVKFYKKLPQGEANFPAPKGPIAKYGAKHFGENPSAKPLLHLALGVLIFGYSLEYYFHHSAGGHH